MSSLFFYFSASVSFTLICLFMFAMNILENQSASSSGNQPYTSMHISGNSMNKLRWELKLADEKKISVVHNFILTGLSSIALIRHREKTFALFLLQGHSRKETRPTFHASPSLVPVSVQCILHQQKTLSHIFFSTRHQEKHKPPSLSKRQMSPPVETHYYTYHKFLLTGPS